MGDFAKYLIESAQQYDYRIKVAGELDKDFSTKCQHLKCKNILLNI